MYDRILSAYPIDVLVIDSMNDSSRVCIRDLLVKGLKLNAHYAHLLGPGGPFRYSQIVFYDRDIGAGHLVID